MEINKKFITEEFKFLLFLWKIKKENSDKEYKKENSDKEYRFRYLIEAFGKNPKTNPTLYKFEPFLVEKGILNKWESKEHRCYLCSINKDLLEKCIIANIFVDKSGDNIMWDIITDYLLQKCKLIGINVTFPEPPLPI